MIASSADIDMPITAPPSPDAFTREAMAEAAMLAKHLDDAAVLDPDLGADSAVSVYLAAKRLAEDAAEPYVRLQARAKDFLRGLVERTGQVRFVAHAGEVYLTRAATRVTYDARALDALCAADENAARLLRPHRRETELAPSLTIRGAR